MSQSAKFQEEICNQWQECENDEIDYYRKQFGDNPTSFKTFAWGYTRATQNAIKKIKDLLSENRLLYLEEMGTMGILAVLSRSEVPKITYIAP